ncbi:Bifunctional solanapyrone synthase [Lachnellula subtilissima]|uniref:Bifunctional solanapyrone synthase n=1 Tax=Lachnellula subtilissima TaxID=602034 RepID=A0A8H8U6H7_9HELO|nr:Bifunctional solanapyrone synthase [Lachnellula subtilissima]
MFVKSRTIAASIGSLVASALATTEGACPISTNTALGEVVSGETFQTSTNSNLGPGCCAYLAKSPIGNRLMTPSDGSYADRAAMQWSLAARLTPRCIILPQSVSEVSQVLTALVEANERQTCQFAVRSGGHTCWPGAASIDYGVMLDLGYLNSTTYHPENGTASILPGARWGEVYSTLLPQGVLVVGGRDPTVGVGGFMLGGGNSFYAAAKGYACDNVANFQVVLANGSIIDANAHTNSDLFQVLKGGSSNVGIVVRYDIYTFQAEDLWGGIVTYPFSTATQQIEALVDFGDNLKNDPNSSAITFFTSTNLANKTSVINVYDYTKPIARPAIFEKFLAIPGNLSDTTRIANLSNMVAELEQPDGFRDTFLTLTFANDVDILTKIVSTHEALYTTLQAAKPRGNWTINTLFQPIPALFGQHGAEAGGNVIGLDRFTDNLMLYQLYLAWQGAEQDDLFNSKGRQAISDIKAASVANHTDNPFIYLNYADRSQAPLEGYGNASVAKIKAASAKYDPNGVFQTLMPGGFKISLVDSDSNSTCAVQAVGLGNSPQVQIEVAGSFKEVVGGRLA